MSRWTHTCAWPLPGRVEVWMNARGEEVDAPRCVWCREDYNRDNRPDTDESGRITQIPGLAHTAPECGESK